MRAWLPGYDVVAAIDLDHALRAVAEEGARPLAGGTDLMVLLESGDLPPGRFVSLWGLPELRGIVEAPDAVTIGALTTYREIQEHELLRREYPLLGAAARVTGALAIQNRGTLGGNLVNASPAADSLPALLAYEAEIELVSRAGTRRVPHRAFHLGYKKLDLRPGELVRAVRLPRSPGGPGARAWYRKVGTREAQAISKVVMAALARIERGVVAECRIALGSVAPVPLRCPKTEQAIVGRTPDAETAARARAAVLGEIAPIDDIRSTAHYRRVVTGNLVARFLADLAAGARVTA